MSIATARKRLKSWGLKSLYAILHKSKTVKLRTALVVPFMFQITLTGGILIFMSFRQGQQNVNNLSYQLLHEINYRVEQEINRYLEIPKYVQKVNIQAIEAGLLKPDNFKQVSQVFWHQVSTFELLDIGYGKMIPNLGIGEYVSAGYSNDQRDISMINRDDPHQWYSVVPDELGNITTVNAPLTEDAQTVFAEAWYKDTIAAGRTIWTKPYRWTSESTQISIDLSTPLYCKNARITKSSYCQKDDQVRGVLATSIGLDKLSKFLKELKIARNGEAFIIEQSGYLVANSRAEFPYQLGSAGANLIKAIDSPDPLIAKVAQSLDQSELHSLSEAKPFDIKYNHEKLFILASSYTIQNDQCSSASVNQLNSVLIQLSQIDCAYPQDWVVVTIVPETDLLADIENATRNTLIFSCISLIAVICIGVITSRWINQGMLSLSEAAKTFAQGNFSHSVVLNQPIQVVELETLSDSLNSMAKQLETSFDSLADQSEAFARFFPSDFFSFLEKCDIREIGLGDYVSREMSILFSDIRSFTDLSESMSPQENFDFINAYLGRVSPTIREHQGFVVKFIGDGLMAIFPRGTDAAVAAGVAQFQQLQDFNHDRHAKGLKPIEIGMGIHTGQVMLGMLGEPRRLQGDAISAQVNFAARLEGLTKYFGSPLLISETTRQNLQNPDRYSLRYLGRVRVKGFQSPMPIYEVLDAILNQEEYDRKQQSSAQLAEAIGYLTEGNFQEARKIFQVLIDFNPTDLTYSLYQDELKQFESENQAWDGVINFRQK